MSQDVLGHKVKSTAQVKKYRSLGRRDLSTAAFFAEIDAVKYVQMLATEDRFDRIEKALVKLKKISHSLRAIHAGAEHPASPDHHYLLSANNMADEIDKLLGKTPTLG